MKHFLYIFNFLFIINISLGQVFDNFSDGELQHNPTWIGDTNHFIVNNANQLQLNATNSGISYLSTYLGQCLSEKQWLFHIKLAFNPSNSNHCLFYLSADKADLTDTTLNGFYLRFGENGNDDAIQLFEQKGNVHQLLARGKNAYIASAFDIWVKVLLNDTGWTIWTAQKADSFFEQQIHFKQKDSISNFLGIKCVYTSSNANKFYFEQIYFGGIISDTTPPLLLKYDFMNNDKSKFSLIFSESIDTSMVSINNFEIIPDIGNPKNILFTNNNSEIILELNKEIPENKLFNLKIKNLFDLAGNVLKDTNITLINYRSRQFEIVINEVMQKSSPEIGLPDAKYIELYNPTNYSINLKDYYLLIGNSKKIFPEYKLKADNYVIVTNASNDSILSKFGAVLSFSSLSINNTEQNISLFNSANELIHNVKISSSWHTDENKSEGGWALEMIDPYNPCGEAENWASSINKQGGTPGNINSVRQQNLDVKRPQISHIFAEVDSIITIYFDEKILPQSLTKTTNYKIDHNLTIKNVSNISDDWKSVSLCVSPSLKNGVIYRLTVIDSIVDCSENVMLMRSSAQFGLSQNAQANDVIINEILFNPKDDGVDFVEIYNRSDKIINLQKLYVSSRQKNGSLGAKKIISENGDCLYPQQYLLLSTNIEKTCQQYNCLYPENLLKINSLPAFPNESGNVILTTDSIIIDEFNYHENMHYSLLKSYDGVSLERISFENQTQIDDNWHSAASSVGFATPGYKNSVYIDWQNKQDSINLFPEIFSPDMDGFDDILIINYQFSTVGYRMTIEIFNIHGQMLKRLVNNELVATEGFFTWDGSIDNHIKATVGQYIILIKLWDLNGNVKKIKKTCTLAIKY